MKVHPTTESIPRVVDGSVRIDVGGGFHPETIATRAGRPLRLTFHRRETWPCSDRVVFPAFGIDAELSAHEDVVIDITPQHAGEYEFTCGMGMLSGTLIVQPAGAADFETKELS